MTQIIAVAYIGPKDKKRDTITGSRLIFPRLTPVDVESAIAHRLLDFPTVFVKAEVLESVLKANADSAEDQAEADRLEQARLAALAAENSFVVKIGNDEIDLAKLTAVQLATLIEAEELELKQDPQEKVGDFRVRVRDAINGKQAGGDGE
ncbi:hypothetical protein [Serratia liquefaciens]|uniref:hypothetical protein n=1 Tax=Serratia liquefaciens TaxID=614 RepID=UPI0021833B9D|nr:hypothetical protein [Serratia liquefaciens]CAI2431213.1 Uncharacterised protein [Serratia liquefaciens]